MDFEVDGEQQLSRFFDYASEEMPNWKDVFAEWGKDFRETQHSVFMNEGAFEGRTRWAELSPAYAEWKAQVYGETRILVRTRRLWNSLISEQHTDHIHDYDENEMRVGTSVPYAIFHQRGTMNMPQRKVLELTQPQKTRWVRICRRVTWGKLEYGASLHDIARR